MYCSECKTYIPTGLDLVKCPTCKVDLSKTPPLEKSKDDTVSISEENFKSNKNDAKTKKLISFKDFVFWAIVGIFGLGILFVVLGKYFKYSGGLSIASILTQSVLLIIYVLFAFICYPLISLIHCACNKRYLIWVRLLFLIAMIGFPLLKVFRLVDFVIPGVGVIHFVFPMAVYGIIFSRSIKMAVATTLLVFPMNFALGFAENLSDQLGSAQSELLQRHSISPHIDMPSSLLAASTSDWGKNPEVYEIIRQYHNFPSQGISSITYECSSDMIDSMIKDLGEPELEQQLSKIKYTAKWTRENGINVSFDMPDVSGDEMFQGMVRALAMSGKGMIDGAFQTIYISIREPFDADMIKSVSKSDSGYINQINLYNKQYKSHEVLRLDSGGRIIEMSTETDSGIKTEATAVYISSPDNRHMITEIDLRVLTGTKMNTKTIIEYSKLGKYLIPSSIKTQIDMPIQKMGGTIKLKVIEINQI